MCRYRWNYHIMLDCCCCWLLLMAPINFEPFCDKLGCKKKPKYWIAFLKKRMWICSFMTRDTAPENGLEWNQVALSHRGGGGSFLLPTLTPGVVKNSTIPESKEDMLTYLLPFPTHWCLQSGMVKDRSDDLLSVWHLETDRKGWKGGRLS